MITGRSTFSIIGTPRTNMSRKIELCMRRIMLRDARFVALVPLLAFPPRTIESLMGWASPSGILHQRVPKRARVPPAQTSPMVHIGVPPWPIRRPIPGLAALLLIAGTAILMRAQTVAPPATGVPGALSDGSTLLSNGWRIAPAGRQLTVGTLPLNLVVS